MLTLILVCTGPSMVTPWILHGYIQAQCGLDVLPLFAGSPSVVLTGSAVYWTTYKTGSFFETSATSGNLSPSDLL